MGSIADCLMFWPLAELWDQRSEASLLEDMSPDTGCIVYRVSRINTNLTIMTASVVQNAMKVIGVTTRSDSCGGDLACTLLGFYHEMSISSANEQLMPHLGSAI